MPPSPPRRLMLGFGILVGACIVFSGMALLWQVPAAWREMRDHWTETSGTVLAARVRSREAPAADRPGSHRQSTPYYVELEYHYVADDARFTGIASAARQPVKDGNLQEATAVANSYKPGDAIPVFYNPKDITGSRLVASGPGGLFWTGLAGGPLLIFSGLALTAWRWSAWKAKKGKSAPS